jgi:putative flavoprotein involved in K+ transport
VSGANGGHTVEFRRYAVRGMTLLGMTQSYKDGIVAFSPDLAENLRRGDADYMSVLDEADAFAARNGLDLPQEPAARIIDPDPACVTDPILALDLKGAGITTIIWATGYAFDYGWLEVGTFDATGKPNHQRGVSTEPGLYFLGLPWQSRRGSSFIWGVWHDARYLADQIGIQRSYRAYNESVSRGAR